MKNLIYGIILCSMREKIKKYVMYPGHGISGFLLVSVSMVLLFGVFCITGIVSGSFDFSDSCLDNRWCSELLCASETSSSASRLLRNGRQRSFQFSRGQRYEGGYSTGSAEDTSFIYSVPVCNYENNVHPRHACRNFWTDFYISALPVRAGPEKFSI